MLVLLPVFLLGFFALIIFILWLLRAKTGWSWLVGLFGALVTWVYVLLSRFLELTPIRLPSWWLAIEADYQISFQMDAIGWVYAFSLVSLLLANMITVSVRGIAQGRPINWAANLTFTSAGLLAILAGDALTLILAWTVIDLLELSFLIAWLNQPRFKQMAVIAFAARVAGTFVVMIAAFASRAEGIALRLTSPSPEVGLALLIAVGLRLGVLPLHLPFPKELPIRRGVGTMLRLVAPASSLVLLARLPADAVPPNLALPLLIFSSLAALYGSLMWLNARNELSGRPYWLIALAGMAIGCVIRSYPAASVAWGITLLLPGGLLFIYSARSLRLAIIPVLAWLGMTGLPFTPAASGWGGLVIPPFNLADILYLIAHAILMAGFLRHTFTPGEPLSSFENWIKIAYPLGLVVLVAAYVLVGILGWEGSLTTGVWWASLISLILTALIFWLANFLRRRSGGENPLWVVVLLEQLGKALGRFFRLEWLYAMLGWVYRLVQQIIQGLTVILEGDGGILWVMVLLALFLITIQGGGL